MQQLDATRETHQRVGGTDLEDGAQIIVGQRSQRRRIDPQGSCRVGGEPAADEAVPAGDGQALGTPVARPCAVTLLDETPVRTRPSVEQHADQREIDHRAAALGEVTVGEQRVEVAAPVVSTGLEVVPAAVYRDIEVGEADAGDLGDVGGRGVQGVVVDDEPSGLPGAGALEQAVRAGAHRAGGLQLGYRLIDRLIGVPDSRTRAERAVVGAHSSSPRPRTFLSSSVPGAAPGVK